MPIRVRVHSRPSEVLGPVRVVIRTNLNQGSRIRRQIIDLIEKNQSYSTDYYDIAVPYNPTTGQYEVDILVHEVGYFEYKVRVESGRKTDAWVEWAPGPNVGISVTPLEYGRDNAIYCAFLRQYIPGKNKSSLNDEEMERTIQQLEQKGAFVIPPSGNFESFKEVIPFIIDELGMRIIHLLPINPVPTSYGRMGMYGSPYATTDYFGIDPTYGSFSQYKTIEEQFMDLTSTIHGHGAKVFVDMVINHTGWASTIHFIHRHWRKVGEDRKIVSPGAWGVTWGDLVELDYSHRDLWEYMARVFLTWCERGIDGFRLDAGYMVPLAVWQYIISKVREEFPRTMFLLEGLGGPWETTEQLVTEGQMNWAYSELFQNYSRRQIVDYLGYAQQVSAGKGVLVHYAETHDNDRLAKKGKAYARMRVWLSGLTSLTGAWGITNGVEWLATEKIDVHRNTALHWGNPDNLVEDIRTLNRILRENPAFWQRVNIGFVDLKDPDLLAFIRGNPDGTNIVACVINLNPDSPKSLAWDFRQGWPASLVKPETFWCDLLDGHVFLVPSDRTLRKELPGGGAAVIRINQPQEEHHPFVPALYDVQAERISLIYKILLNRFKAYEIGKLDGEKLLRQVADFRSFIAMVNQTSLEVLHSTGMDFCPPHYDSDILDRYTALWTFRESNKEFLLSGDKWLVVETFVPCTVYLKMPEKTLREDSLPSEDGTKQCCYFPPMGENLRAKLTFNWKLERQGIIQRQWQDQDYPLWFVPSGRRMPRPPKYYPLRLSRRQLSRGYPKILLTNGRGGYCQVSAKPNGLDSKYDALLAAALDANRPNERLVLAKWIKETVQVGQKYFDLDESFCVSFTRYPYPTWTFSYDDGENTLHLERMLLMHPEKNTVYIRYRVVDSKIPVTLFSKICVECRGSHDVLRAADTLRAEYPAQVKPLDAGAGFAFHPRGDITLHVQARTGEFVYQPHWIEGMEHRQDADWGLDRFADGFSPGVFSVTLRRKESQTLRITIEEDGHEPISVHASILAITRQAKQLSEIITHPAAANDTGVKMLSQALDQFLVQSASGWVLLSGYPWLGMRVRDALHCVGGLLAAGRLDVARQVVLQCARTEKHGMLEDWLYSGHPERSCTESSLRLFLAARIIQEQEGQDAFLQEDAGGRTLAEVLISIYESMVEGRCAGASLDPESGMMFSPAGFSWMNTTHPQATPRSGYCVEMQALWYESLAVLAELYPPFADGAWEIRGKLERSFGELFWIANRGYMADLLVAEGPVPARQAKTDPALRFNQLAAIRNQMIPPDQARKAMEIISRRLLVPGAVRSLSEDPLTIPLAILDEQGKPLVDPRLPYCGTCFGDEQRRRLAYHNGTAWPSAYPAFIEVRASVYHFSDLAVRQALAYFEPVWAALKSDGIGTLSEMRDGNYPHTERGCFAYAPAVAEALRVYMRLKYQQDFRSHSRRKNRRPDSPNPPTA